MAEKGTENLTKRLEAALAAVSTRRPEPAMKKEPPAPPRVGTSTTIPVVNAPLVEKDESADAPSSLNGSKVSEEFLDSAEPQQVAEADTLEESGVIAAMDAEGKPVKRRRSRKTKVEIEPDLPVLDALNSEVQADIPELPSIPAVPPAEVVEEVQVVVEEPELLEPPRPVQVAEPPPLPPIVEKLPEVVPELLETPPPRRPDVLDEQTPAWVKDLDDVPSLETVAAAAPPSAQSKILPPPPPESETKDSPSLLSTWRDKLRKNEPEIPETEHDMFGDNATVSGADPLTGPLTAPVSSSFTAPTSPVVPTVPAPAPEIPVAAPPVSQAPRREFPRLNQVAERVDPLPGAPVMNGRQARVRIKSIDPWSVMKISFLLSIALAIVGMVSTGIVWTLLGSTGLWDSVNTSVRTILDGEQASSFDVRDYVGTGRVLGLAALISLLNVFLITAIATLGAFLYNMASALLGGLDIVMVEEK
jgi:hypothetical protein